jgi:4-hydroxythreonine-4-phosphate dehydrogenase
VKPVVAITLGDPWGIGPEVIAVALANRRVTRSLVPLIFGHRSVLERAANLRRVALPAKLRVVEPLASLGQVEPGRPPARGGVFPIRYLESAVAATKAGFAQALCTGPIHKRQMTRAGFRFTGHTDFLANRFGVERAVMLLQGPHLRVALATVHVPYVEVPVHLDQETILSTLRILVRALRRNFGIARPRIGVAGLNPHAGEEGLLGREEARVIAPAIARARREGITAEGPLPGDSLFARAVREKRWDALLAMTHDQGLGPIKVLDFEQAVNVTLGLPIPRTSPDHGVAYDIAGKGIADASSMIEALVLSAEMVDGEVRGAAPRTLRVDRH